MEKLHGGIEKRKHVRRIFPATERPIFRSLGVEFEIKDISRSGLRFCHKNNLKISGWVDGAINLADGTRVEVEGIVVRFDSKDIGLSFIGDLEDNVYRQITYSI
ncbi:MAG: PilZ domain-containing protein [Desulfatirhabdiaceae bacterium]